MYWAFWGAPLLENARKVTLESLQPEDGWQTNAPAVTRLQKIKTLLIKDKVDARSAAATKQHMSAIRDLSICGSEAEAREILVNGGSGALDRLSLGFVSESRREFIKAEDEREGITLGDYKDQLPYINNLVMHLDVPSGDVAEPSTFVSSIWSVLEVALIAQLTVVLLERSHLGELKQAVQRRFGPAHVFGTMR